MKSMKKTGGLRRRWLLNTVGVVFALGLVCVMAVTASYATYYYSNMQSDMENRAKTTTDFFADYINQDYGDYYQSCITYAKTFEDKGKIELQFINNQGSLVASSYGPWAGPSPSTSDIWDAISIRDKSSYIGRDPDTGERIMAVSCPMIYSNGEVIGVLRYVTSTRLVNRQIILVCLVCCFVLTVVLAVVLLFVLPGFLDRQYLSVQTLTMVYSSAQILILLAMGATLVMLTRNIDVSVGSITGMCAVLLGMLLNAGYSLPVACVATLLLGLLAGFFNGVLVAWLKIPAIVATLGTLGLYRGIMLLWTGGKWIEGLPAELKQLSAPLLLGVSAIGWLTIILVAFMAWLLAKTAFGRSFYATGDNLQGARQLGVRTEAIRIVAFSLNGCMAALAGIVFASQIGFIPNQTGTGLEMKAIAACVLGGISLLGGSGAIIGAVLGAWFLTQIDSVLVLLRIPAWWNDFIAGLVLLAVLVFDGRLRCALERNLRRQKYARFMTPPPSVKPASSGKKREAA